MRHLRRRLLVELSGLDVVDEPFGLARHERLGADLPTAQVLGLHGIHDLDSLAAARRPDQVERSADAVKLLGENRRRLGGYNVRIIDGAAPAALEALPAPDCVFVGGSGGAMRCILQAAKRKNPAVRVAVNAIALETLHAAQAALAELGFAEIEVVQLAAGWSDRIP